MSHAAGDDVIVHTPTGNYTVKILQVE